LGAVHVGSSDLTSCSSRSSRKTSGLHQPPAPIASACQGAQLQNAGCVLAVDGSWRAIHNMKSANCADTKTRIRPQLQKPELGQISCKLQPETLTVAQKNEASGCCTSPCAREFHLDDHRHMRPDTTGSSLHTMTLVLTASFGVQHITREPLPGWPECLKLNASPTACMQGLKVSSHCHASLPCIE
jgi:hypothetical protein